MFSVFEKCFERSKLGYMPLSFAVVTETIFSWPGLGKLIIDAIFALELAHHDGRQNARIDIAAAQHQPNFLADEALRLIEKNGFDNLSLAFYKQGDIGNDGVWDNWKLEGPSMVWYFRGAPHVHCWVHVRENAKEA